VWRHGAFLEPTRLPFGGFAIRTWLFTRALPCAILAITLSACVVSGASAKSSQSRCTTVLTPKKNVATAIDRARAGTTICLIHGSYPQLRLGSRRVAPRHRVTIRSLSGRRATIAGMSLDRAHHLLFEQLIISKPVSFRADDSSVSFAHDQVTRTPAIKVTPTHDPDGTAVGITAPSARGHKWPGVPATPTTPTKTTPTTTTPTTPTKTTPTTTTPTTPTKTTPTTTTPTTPTKTTPTTTTTTPTPTVPATTDCFASPGACGYPDPAYDNVGANCASLPSFNPASPPAGTYYNGSGLLEVTSPKTTVANLDFPSNVSIYFGAGSSGSTLDNVCVLANGDAASGSTAVSIAGGVTGTLIENSTLGGANTTTQAADQAITNDTNNANTTALNDEIINCGECVHGTWTLNNSYVDVSATINGEHYEDWYFSDGTISANHDVFLNPQEQTAEIFGNTNGGNGGAADNHITLTNNLLAGGGFMLYTNSSSTSIGSSTMDITDNRFARCTSKTAYNSTTGGTACTNGTDGFGYWPQGGYFGVDSWTYCTGTGQTWTNNVWDDNNTTIAC
jgi:hypothetical protein